MGGHAHQKVSVSTIWDRSPELSDPAELIGFTVEAQDGRIGTVDTAYVAERKPNLL